MIAERTPLIRLLISAIALTAVAFALGHVHSAEAAPSPSITVTEIDATGTVRVSGTGFPAGKPIAVIFRVGGTWKATKSVTSSEAAFGGTCTVRTCEPTLHYPGGHFTVTHDPCADGGRFLTVSAFNWETGASAEAAFEGQCKTGCWLECIEFFTIVQLPPDVIVGFKTTVPTRAFLSLPQSPSAVVTRVNYGGDPNVWATDHTFRVSGLPPGTEHLLTGVVYDEHLNFKFASKSLTTFHRSVEVQFNKVWITNDSDDHGEGECKFFFWVNSVPSGEYVQGDCATGQDYAFAAGRTIVDGPPTVKVSIGGCDDDNDFFFGVIAGVIKEDPDVCSNGGDTDYDMAFHTHVFDVTQPGWYPFAFDVHGPALKFRIYGMVHVFFHS